MKRSILGKLPLSARALVPLAVAATAAISCHDIDTTRIAPPSATLGDDMYGVFCDRLGASSFTEDLTGASYRAICHFDKNGKYGDKVDVSGLPKPETAKHEEARRLSVAKLETMARRRNDLIHAINAIFPDDVIPDVRKGGDATIRLHDALLDFSQTLVPLYESNPIDAKAEPLFPTQTRSMGRLLGAMADSAPARDALSRIWGRRGYRPFPVGIGAMRPALAYPDLRKLTTSALAVLGPDGTAAPELQHMLTVAKQEFVTSKPVVAPQGAYKLLDTAAAQPNRPRSNIEVTAAIMLSEDDSFAANDSEPERYIALRDRRGFVSITGGAPAPFSDLDNDGYPDVDAFGRFVTGNGGTVPFDPPFFIPGVTVGQVDAFGRPKDAPYAYIDTSRTALGAIARHLVPLVDPTEIASADDPAPWSSEHEALMYALAGAYTLYGPREAAEYDYPAEAPDDQKAKAVKLPYQRFRAEDSPIPDLLHAAGQVLADEDSDALLLSLIDLFENHENTVAALMGAALKIRQIAKDHDQMAALGVEPKAELAYDVTIWEEIAQIAGEIARRPGLTEALLKAMASDVLVSSQGSVGKSNHMGETLSTFMLNRDKLDYNPQSINAPALNVTVGGNSIADPQTAVDQTKPKSGDNRSCLQRSLQIIHDANGGPSCNKAGGLVHINLSLIGFNINLTWPITGFPVFDTPYTQCELFQFDNLAVFYLDTMLPLDHPKRSKLEILASGLNFIINTGASVGLDVDETFAASSGIDGMTLHPTPQALNRLVFFGATSDLYPTISLDPLIGSTNSVTNTFVSDLIEPVSAAHCPPNANGVPFCADVESTLRVRDKETIFLWERLGFYEYLQPMVIAFAEDTTNNDVNQCNAPASYTDCTGEQLFVALIDTLNRHWPTKDHGDECQKSGNAKTNKSYCSEAGVANYEPLLADAFRTDLIHALHDFAKVAVDISKITVQRGPAKGQTWTGAQVLEKMTKILFDPAYAKSVNMVDRKGNKSTLWVDGTVQPQVTGYSLFADALHGIDVRFDTACSCAGKSGKELDDCNQALITCQEDAVKRKAQWKQARSLLVDEFLSVDGSGGGASFHNKATPRVVTSLLRVVREQLNANCPDREAGTPCVWAKKTLADKLSEVIGGPVFAAIMDVQEKIRRDPAARRELERFLQYALVAAGNGEELQAMLASLADMLQVMADDGNMSPIFNAVASAMSPESDAEGPGAADTTIKVLKALTGDEYDRYHVLDHVLPKMVTPMDDGSNLSPVEIFMDVIADVNRIDASSPDPLQADDYQTIMTTVRDFLVDDTRGLEQFYHIVQNRPRK